MFNNFLGQAHWNILESQGSWEYIEEAQRNIFITNLWKHYVNISNILYQNNVITSNHIVLKEIWKIYRGKVLKRVWKIKQTLINNLGTKYKIKLIYLLIALSFLTKWFIITINLSSLQFLLNCRRISFLPKLTDYFILYTKSIWFP